MPPELKFRLRSRAACMKSLAVLKPVLGCTPSIRPELEITTRGLRSASLKGMVL